MKRATALSLRKPTLLPSGHCSFSGTVGTPFSPFQHARQLSTVTPALMAKPALPRYARSSRSGQTRSWALGKVDSGSEVKSYHERYEPELTAKIAFVRETLEEFLTHAPCWHIVRSKVLANRQVHDAHAAHSPSTCSTRQPDPLALEAARQLPRWPRRGVGGRG